ncbi:MAG: Uricase (urate oxidase), partial [uncultured Solirubrobacteraceae bacterium]
ALRGEARLHRLRRSPARPEMAGRRALGGELRHQLRGRLRALRAGRRRLHRERADRVERPEPAQIRPRPRRRRHVRVRQPRRLLAPAPLVPGARAAAHRLRLRPGAGAQPGGRRRHPRFRLGHLLARLALGEAFRDGRGGGARAHPQGGREPRTHRGQGRGLVLPLRAEREHAPLGRGARRLPLRQRLLRRRAALLGDGGRQAATGGALLAGEQRRQVRRLDRHRRAVVLLRPRRLRHAARGGRDASE